jgi:hypothetical protein
MLLGITYNQAKTLAPKQDYTREGLYSGQIITLLRKGGLKCKVYGRVVAVPFRHYNPRIRKGIIQIVGITKNSVYPHSIVINNNTLHDPNMEKSIKLEDAKKSKVWRSWMVFAEIGERPRTKKQVRGKSLR